MRSTMQSTPKRNHAGSKYSEFIPKGFQRAAQGCHAEVASTKAGLPWEATHPTQPSSTLKGLRSNVLEFLLRPAAAYVR